MFQEKGKNALLSHSWLFRSLFTKGDRTEITYNLLGYGIPVDLLPLTDSGNIKTTNLLQWLKVRKAYEENMRNDYNGVSSDPTAIGFIDINNIECPGMHENL